MRLTPHIYLVGGGSLGVGISHEADCQVYLIDGETDLALVDAGSGFDTEWILKNIQADGFDPGKISSLLITHYHMDHIGGAAGLRQRTGAKVVCSEGAADAIRQALDGPTGLAQGIAYGWFPSSVQVCPCEVDLQVAGGEVLQVGNLRIQCMDAPGHCQAHTCYLLFEEGVKQLFSGDAVFANGQILLEYLPGADLWDYRQTIFDLEKLDIQGIFPGHGGFCLHYGQEYLCAAANQLRQGHVPRNFL